MSDGRCSGHCCRRFPLTATYAEIKAAAEKVKAGEPDRYQDSVFIADMLVPLAPNAEGKEYFTCRHHDAASGNCGVYEQRPRLCREHPFYGRHDEVCNTPGCTLDHVATLRANPDLVRTAEMHAQDAARWEAIKEGLIAHKSLPVVQ